MIRPIDLSKFDEPIEDFYQLQEALDDTHKRLSDPTYRKHVAMHEAGHAYYFLKGGAKRVAYQATAPHLTDSGYARVGAAAVRVDEDESEWHGTGSDVARACAAGVCATQFFFGSTEGGGSDKTTLRDVIGEVLGISDSHLDTITNDLWVEAILKIERDLSQPNIQISIKRIADHFEAWLLCEHEEDGWPGDWEGK
jgi:hypothetical protein